MTLAGVATHNAAVAANGRLLRRRLMRSPVTVIGLVLLAMALAAGLLADVIAPFGPSERVPGGLSAAFSPPGGDYLFGTDGQGRDVFSRILYGARLSLVLGLASVAVGLLLGGLLGTVAGSFGGLVDGVLMRIVDMLLAIPGLLLAVGVVAALGPGLPQIVFAVALANVPIFARLLRSSLLVLKTTDYVIAAQVMGAGRLHLLVRHLLPNARTPLLVQAALALAVATIDIAGLGYLGLGPADPGIAEWGTMLTEAARYFRSAPYLILFPALAISLTAVAFNLVAEGLREALDPRLVK